MTVRAAIEIRGERLGTWSGWSVRLTAHRSQHTVSYIRWNSPRQPPKRHRKHRGSNVKPSHLILRTDVHPHSQAIRHELPIIHAKRHCQYQSHDPTDQRQSSLPLIETERPIDDLDTFRLEVDGSENCSAHDADCEDDWFREEKPDGSGDHCGDKSPYVGHLAGLVTGKLTEPCDFLHVLQTAVQDHAWSALLCEPEADEDGCEDDCSEVEDPGPNMVSNVLQIRSAS